MKRIILTVITAMTFVFSNAQEAKFGIKGGLNISNWSGDTEGGNLKSKVGFNGGVFVAIKFNDKFTLQPEVLYSTQGTKSTDQQGELNGTTYTGEVNFKMSYINIPVMFKFYAAEKFNIEAGPQIGFLTSAKATTKLNGFSQSVDQDVKDFFESVDFGLNLGAGYDFTQNISAGLRYNLGLSNIEKTESGDDSKLHNSVFSLSLAYKF